jgi:hypothetical protein
MPIGLPHGANRIYKRRKETVERSFADAKQLHGHRYASFRGLLAVTCQRLLAAAAQNIKKWLAHRPAWGWSLSSVRTKTKPRRNRRGLSAV